MGNICELKENKSSSVINRSNQENFKIDELSTGDKGIK